MSFLAMRSRLRIVGCACAPLLVSNVGAAEDAEMHAYGALSCREDGGSDARGCGRELFVALEAERGPQKIIRGHPARVGKYPWVVAVARMQPNGKFTVYCGGSVVASTWVLTAAHCKVKNGDYVLVGRQDLNTDAGVPVKVDRIVDGVPQYMAATKANDAVLLHLETAAGVKEVALNEDPNIEDLRDTDLTIAGWGTTSYFGKASNILLEATVTIRNLAGCQNQYDRSRRTVPATAFCANGEKAQRVDELTGETVSDACQGDSGGGAYWLDQTANVYKLVGVVSWGIGCGDDAYPGVYTRASWISKWIKPVIKNI